MVYKLFHISWFFFFCIALLFLFCISKYWLKFFFYFLGFLVNCCDSCLSYWQLMNYTYFFFYFTALINELCLQNDILQVSNFLFLSIDWCYNRLIPPLVLLSPLTFLTIFLIDDDYWIVIAATLIELTYIFAINWSMTLTFFLDFFFISLSDSTEFHEIGRKWRREKGCIFFFFWQIAPYPKISTIPHSIFLFSN